MNTMAWKPDWNKYSFFATVVFGILALIAYLRPPDPANPVKFDFLSTAVSLSMPLWLAILTGLLVVGIIIYVGTRYRRLKNSPAPPPQEIETRDRQIAGLKAQLEARKQEQVPVAAKPAEDKPAGAELIFNSPDDISIKITPNEWQHLKGYIVNVINRRLGAINRVKVTVYSAQSFDSRHGAYRDGRDFSGFARIEPDPIGASHSGKSLWLVRKDRGEQLLVGDDTEHPLRWPDADPSTIQRWRLTVAIDGQTVPAKSSDAIVVLKQVKMTLILTWDKDKNEFGIAEESATGNAALPEVAPTDPRLSITVIENHKNGVFRSGAAITIKNVGGSEAHSLVLQDVSAGTHTIAFPGNIGVLNAGDATSPIAGRVEDYGPLQQHHISTAMLDAWNDLRDIKIDHMSFPATATYSDYQGRKFKASWNYEFLPIKCHVKHLHSGKEEITGQPYEPYLSVSAIKTERLP